MFGLITMLLSTLGATGMGSLLKMAGGIVASIAEKKAASEKRELARELAITNANADLQKALFGEPDKEATMFVRATRRFLACIGMCNFAIISILCTLWPGVALVTFTPPESKTGYKFIWGLIDIPAQSAITSTITTGHIALVSVTTLAAIVGFYFTPSAGGK
jgi:hypothetical protein